MSHDKTKEALEQENALLIEKVRNLESEAVGLHRELSELRQLLRL